MFTPKLQTTESPEPLAVRRPVAAAMLGMSKSKIDHLIGTGKIAAVKDGRALLILTKSLREYLASLPPAKLGLYGHYKTAGGSDHQ